MARLPRETWILTSAVFMSHFVTGGVSFSIGVYYITFREHFLTTNGHTAWIGSLNLGMLCGIGPLASYMIDKLGVRTTVLVGGLLSSVGILLGSLSPNLLCLFLSFGIVTGLGYGLVFTGGIVVIGITLTRFRTLAMGISLSGIGLGNFVYPFFANHLIDVYGWRGALMITSAFTLHVCVFGMFMTGRSIVTNDDIIEKIDTESENVTTEDIPAVIVRNPLLEQVRTTHTSSLSLENAKSSATRPPVFMNSYQNLRVGKIHPYLTDVTKARSSELIYSMMGRSTSYQSLGKNSRYNSVQSLARKGTPKSHTTNDIASKTNIAAPEFQTQYTSQLLDSEDSSLENLTPNSKFFSFTLPSYWLLHCNTLLFCFSLSVVLTHISAYSQYQGVNKASSNILISINGAANVIGRVALGALTQQSFVNTFALHGACYGIAGLAVLIMTFWTSFVGLLSCVTVFGLFSAAFGPVLSEATLEVVGVNHFNYGYGFLMISMALGTTLGAPTAGWLYDVTYQYTSSFYFGAGCLFLSSVVLVPLMIISQRSKCSWKRGEPLDAQVVNVN